VSWAANWDMPRFTAPADCATVDPDIFYPAKGENSGRAKAICRRCAALPECAQWISTHDEEFGVWAATSAYDRKLLRQGRHRQAAA
jgi:WhiB family redox-sensing transcriptional regulator